MLISILALIILHGLVTFKKDADAEQYRETVAKRRTEMAEIA